MKSQTQIETDPYKIHKHKSQPIHHQDLPREREREREREKLNHTQPNAKLDQNQDPIKTQIRSEL